MEKIMSEMNYGEMNKNDKQDADFMLDFGDVIKELRPGAKFEVELYEGYLKFNKFEDPEDRGIPAEDEIWDLYFKNKELFEKLEYSRLRQQELSDWKKPTLQLQEIWDEIDKNGSITKESDWFQKVKEVKDRYPKPE
jgi:hypothetical protein